MIPRKELGNPYLWWMTTPGRVLIGWDETPRRFEWLMVPLEGAIFEVIRYPWFAFAL